jgi:hypothetical protein
MTKTPDAETDIYAALKRDMADLQQELRQLDNENRARKKAGEKLATVTLGDLAK